MKYAIYIYILLSGTLFAESIRQGCKVNDETYVANVTTEFLSKHSVSPKEQSLVDDIKVFEQIAIKHIEANFGIKIDLSLISDAHRSLEFHSLSDGDSRYYYAVYSVGVKREDGKFNLFRIPIALDHTVISPKLYK